MIYEKEIGILNTQTLMSAVPMFLLEAKEKKFVIALAYLNGMQRNLQFNTEKERDAVMKTMVEDLNCTEVNHTLEV